MRAQEPVLVCVACGHRHTTAEGCADHQWTDACPYEGRQCPPRESREETLRRLKEEEVEEEVEPARKAFGYPTATIAFIPRLDAPGNLIVSFVRVSVNSGKDPNQ